MLSTRLLSLNSKAVSFDTRKASFKTVIDEFQVSDSNIYLLINWRWPESAKCSIRIRASNANNLRRGQQMSWQRLDERYDAAEMLEVRKPRTLRVQTL